VKTNEFRWSFFDFKKRYIILNKDIYFFKKLVYDHPISNRLQLKKETDRDYE